MCGGCGCSPHVSTYMATPDDNNHAAIPMRSATRFKKRIERRTQEQPLVAERRGGTHYARNDRSRTRRTQEVSVIAACSHFTRKKLVSCSGFLPNTSPTQRSCSHYNVSTSQSHHFPSSPLPFVTTSHRHHFPSSPLPFVTTALPHHFPSAPLPLVTTSQSHHFPSSPLTHRHHFPSSPLLFVTTALRHHPVP